MRGVKTEWVCVLLKEKSHFRIYRVLQYKDKSTPQYRHNFFLSSPRTKTAKCWFVTTQCNNLWNVDKICTIQRKTFIVNCWRYLVYSYIQKQISGSDHKTHYFGGIKIWKLLLNGDLLADLCDEEEELYVKNTLEVWWSIGEQGWGHYGDWDYQPSVW